MERAHETIEHHAEHTDPWARRMAVLVSILAAALAITGIGGNAAQNAYMTLHVALSNDWAFYQAKNLRAVVRSSEAELLASLPNATDTEIQKRIKEAQDYTARMRDEPETGDGMKQLAARAQAKEIQRDEAAHRYHNYEYALGGLEIAIVLASVSVVTRMRVLGNMAAVIGAIACATAIGVAIHLI
jgi:hypothetical protein